MHHDFILKLLLNQYHVFGQSASLEKGLHKEELYKVPYKFTGKELNPDTGLYYYSARYYHPGLGRFTGIDPWQGDYTDPQSLNKYAYTRNNPVIYTDPSGMCVAGCAGDYVVITLTVEAVCYIGGAIVTASVGSVAVANQSNKLNKNINSSVNKNYGKSVDSLVLEAKGKERIRDTGLQGLSDGEVQEEYNNSSGKEKKRYEKELKNRGVRNKQKRQNQYNFSNGEYTVQSGDTLSEVFGNDWSKIAEYNNLKNPDLIFSGQVLSVPDVIVENTTSLDNKSETLDNGIIKF